MSVESLAWDILPAALAGRTRFSTDRSWHWPPEPLEEGEETATRKAPAHCGPLVTVRKPMERMVHFFASTSFFRLSFPLHRTSLPIPVFFFFSLSLSCICRLPWYDVGVVFWPGPWDGPGSSWCGTANSWCVGFFFSSTFPGKSDF